MHVSLMAPTERSIGSLAQQRRGRGRRRPCARPPHAWAERYREDLYVVHRILINRSILKITSAKTKELDALRFKDRDLSVVGTLEFGQFGVVGPSSSL